MELNFSRLDTHLRDVVGMVSYFVGEHMNPDAGIRLETENLITFAVITKLFIALERLKVQSEAFELRTVDTGDEFFYKLFIEPISKTEATIYLEAFDTYEEMSDWVLHRK